MKTISLVLLGGVAGTVVAFIVELLVWIPVYYEPLVPKDLFGKIALIDSIMFCSVLAIGFVGGIILTIILLRDRKTQRHPKTL